jgi:predicted dehydrogenase
MLRIAFLGIDHPHGAHWRQTLENFPDRIEISAIVPGFSGALASLEERYAAVPRFATVEQLIEGGEFDAAVVALPNSEAAPAIVKLADAGKHILTEKTAATDAAAFRPLVDAVRRNKVAFQNGYMWRYDAGADRLREMFAESRFGKPIHVEMSFVTSDVRRRGPDHYLFDADQSGGGFFNWLGCHQLDLLPYVVGRPITAVTARVGTFGATPTSVEDGGAVILELDGGDSNSGSAIGATLVGGYWLPRWAGESRWVIYGTERWVHWLPTKPGTGGEFQIHGPQPQWHAMEETFTLTPDPTPGYGGARGIRLVEDWLAAISTGRDTRNTPETGLAVLRVLDAIYESSRTGRRIEIA